jgi:hypothetical protein
MPRSTRTAAVSFLLGLVAGCARPEVRLTPESDINLAMRWRMESNVNRAIDRLINSGMFFWGQWRLSGPITVTEDGVASTWEGMAIEARFENVVRPRACLPGGYLALFLWKPLPDSSGVDGLVVGSPLPITADDHAVGDWRPCAFQFNGPRHGPLLSRLTTLPSSITDSWRGALGEAHFEPIGVGASGAPCRLASGRTFEGRCEEITVGATIRATLRHGRPADSAKSELRTLVIGPGRLPGVRTYEGCPPSTTVCADSIVLVRAREALRARPWWLDQYPLQEAGRYVTVWHGDTALRTTIAVRFKRSSRIDEIEQRLTRWWAVVEARGSMGSLLLRVPDPGPGSGAFDRMIERLRRERGVAAVFPVRRDAMPLGRPGSLVVTVHDAARRPIANALVCQTFFLSGGGREMAKFCRVTEGGRAAFDSLPAWDFPVYAGRPGCPEPNAWVQADSAAARIEPGKTTTITFQLESCRATSAER